MAINFAYVVPKEEVEKAGADWGKKPVGTGAFKFVEWVPGQRIVLERNKDYFRSGVPYLDKLTFEFGQDPTVAVLRLKNGEVDIVGDGIPPAQFTEIMADPANKDLIAVGDQLHTGYVTMNVTQPPFDNLKVRQAVNMAINKDRIVRLINNRGVPAVQALPPAMPGYNQDNKGYAYDPGGGQEAPRRSRPAGRLHDRALCDECRSQSAHRASDPAGSRGDRHQGRDPLARASGSHRRRRLGQGADDLVGRHGVDRRLSGSRQFLLRHPGLCRGGGRRLELVEILQQGARCARREGRRDGQARSGRTRIGEWKGVFDDVLKDAPWAPVFNEKRFTYHSARLGGDPSLFTDPIHIPVNYDYIFAKDAQ